MNHSVEFFEQSMTVASANGGSAFVNFVTGDAHWYVGKARITVTRPGGLFAFCANLPTNLQKLAEKARRGNRLKNNRLLRWRVGDLEFKFSSVKEIPKVVKKFSKIANDLGPLLELGKIIFEQLQLTPLHATTSFKVFMPYRKIDGVPVKEWLEIRQRAALKIDPNTAEVTSSYREVFDPYNVYPELPEGCSCLAKEGFVRNPGSDVWVWDGDLPSATEKALRKRFEQERKGAKIAKAFVGR